MDTRTQEIRREEDLSEADKKSGRYVPIPADQVEKVQAMNRQQRRAWAAHAKRKMRKKLRKELAGK